MMWLPGYAGIIVEPIDISGGAFNQITRLTYSPGPVPPPVITQQPADATLPPGQTATLIVSATGLAPLQYQWFRGMNALVGEIDSTLRIANLTTNHTGDYKVVVNNTSPVMTTSRVARLAVVVLPPPTITQQPQDVAVNVGATVSFLVQATGSAPLQYQWFRNNVSLANETSATLILRNVTTNQAGAYRVFVSNVAGSASSAAATLTVNNPFAPPKNDAFANRMALIGASVSATNSNANATREAGEPNHTGNTGGKSLWWSWTAPRSGSVTLNTSGSNADTMLAIYTGSILANLILVASNDDDPRGGTNSMATFWGQAGVTYQIAVGRLAFCN